MTRFRLGFTMLTWVMLLVALSLSDAHPDALVLGGIVAVAVALAFSAIDLVRSSSQVEWARAPDPEVEATRDETVKSLVDQIRRSHRTPSSALRNTLVDIVDVRLLDRHGIDRMTQPERARQVLAPRLRLLTEQPRLRLSGLTEFDAVLTDIDAL